MKEKFKKIVNSKIFKNSIWLTILQIVNTVIPILTIPYIIGVLGAEEYGIFSISLNWILYFQVFVEFGFGLSGARKVSIMKNKNDLNKIFNNIISARIILFGISFVGLNIIALASRFSFKMYLCMIILFIMILGTTFQLTWLFQGKQDMKFITVINAISRMVSVALIFILVKTKKDIYVYCFLYSITMLLSSIISMGIAKKKYNLKFNFSKLKDIKIEIEDGKFLFASAAMTKIFSGFGITMLGIIAGNVSVGIYSAIYKIPYVLTMFFSPISQALYPFCSGEFRKSFELGTKKVKKICTAIFFLFGFISVIIIIFRKEIIYSLFGEEYLQYSIIVIPLVIQFLFGVINNFIGIQVLVSSGNQKSYSISFIIGCIMLIISNFILANIWGIYGVAIAALIGEIGLTISLMFNYKKVKKREIESHYELSMKMKN
ncbi:MAG: flippase [Clostridium sp.]